ncbi:MAG: site-specific integrase [Rikenellaceae bacterium]
MKRGVKNTTVSVKLRKSETAEAWYLYLESYPVYKGDSSTPRRDREFLGRTITTPQWDKSKVARTDGDKKSYRVKRDINGVILCKSSLDMEHCRFADEVRKIRQKEYDTIALYSESEAEKAELLELQQQDFISYMRGLIDKRHKNSSESIRYNWLKVVDRLKEFAPDGKLPFCDIKLKTIEEFKSYLLSATCKGGRKSKLSQNSASTYFSVFKAALKEAFVDGYFTVDISAKVKAIPAVENRREALTEDELNRLIATKCDKLVLKRAAIFSALTGLRLSDIQKLKWSEVSRDGDSYKLNFNQQKTKGVEYTPISDQAYQLCGKPQAPEMLVFDGLPDSAWISVPLRRWIKAAGIKRNITFHCLSHIANRYTLKISTLQFLLA